MKVLNWCKDGGEQSTVKGLFIIEIKSLFSIVLLRFSDGSRDAFHSHAFNCWSWVLTGKLIEDHINGQKNPLPRTWRELLLGFGTYRTTFHKVTSFGTSWVLSVRGPWSKQWMEYLPDERRLGSLEHGRVEAEARV